jgi:cytoskeletal protein CcmA (bactofilin family)
MFGRRNPDRPLDAPQQMPQEGDLDLDMLDELPDIPAPAAAPSQEPREEPPPSDPVWHAATPSILGPSVTRLLQEAEATHIRPEDAALPVAPTPPAPAETQRTPVTQQLFPLPQAQPEPSLADPAPRAAAPGAQPAVANGALATRQRPVAESVIGPDDFFDGRYRSERGVRIQGNARGSIESRQYIFVEAGAQVEADLSAEDITISGDFKGKIVCRRRLEITANGKIDGQVQTSLLVVQEGGAIDGELHMRVQEAAAEAS